MRQIIIQGRGGQGAQTAAPGAARRPQSAVSLKNSQFD